MNFWRKTDSRAALFQAAKLLVHNFGGRSEAIICEVYDRAFFRIVHIENPLSGLAVGDIFPHLTPDDLRSDAFSEMRSAPDGRITRISAAPLTCAKGEMTGCIVTCLNITELFFAQNLLHGLTGYASQSGASHCDDVGEMMDLIIEQASTAIGKPVSYMNRADKKEFIRHLDERGIFQIKKSSEKVANFLDISKFTLYACLEEIRTEKQLNPKNA